MKFNIKNILKIKYNKINFYSLYFLFMENVHKNSNINSLEQSKQNILYSSSNNNNENEKNSISNNNSKFYMNQEDNSNRDTNNIPQLTKNEILNYNHLVFMNHATYIKKYENYFLTQQNLYKILRDCKILPQAIKLNEIDIIFKSISPKSLQINFNQFLQFLIKIVENVFPKEFKNNKKITVNFFMNNFLSNYSFLYENDKVPIENLYKCQYKSIENLISYQPNENILILIQEIVFTIEEIYAKYFQYELEKNIELANKSVINLINFCRDFEILPYVINETQIITYYNLSIDYKNLYQFKLSQNMGIKFKLNNFMLFLIHISLYSFAKNYDNNLEENSNSDDVNKFLLFLEKLECSKGMKNFSRKLNRPSANKLTLLPPKELYLKIEGNNNLFNEENNNLNKKENIFEIIQNNNLIKKNLKELETTYIYFSKIGDKLNFNQMNLSSYIKFLKHCSLLSSNEKNFNKKNNEKKYNNKKNNYSINESDVNVIFSLLTGPRNYNNSKYYQNLLDKNSGISTFAWNNFDSKRDNKAINNFDDKSKDEQVKINKLNFASFLVSFKYIAEKIYPEIKNYNDAINKLLNNFILPNLVNENNIDSQNPKLNNCNETIILLKENIDNIYNILSQNKETNDFLNRFTKVISNYYYFYYEKKTNFISFQKLFEFYKDFGLFPDLINLLQLKEIFNYLSMKKKKKNKSLKENLNLLETNYLSFSEFIYSLGITALIYDFNENFNNLNKLLYLVEKMNQSKGIKKCNLKKGRTYTHSNDLISFLLEMKKLYPEYYNLNSNVENFDHYNKTKKVLNIDDIYSDEEENNSIVENNDSINSNNEIENESEKLDNSLIENNDNDNDNDNIQN